MLEPKADPEFVLLEPGLYGSSPKYAQPIPEFSEEFKNYSRHARASGDPWNYLKFVLREWYDQRTSRGG